MTLTRHEKNTSQATAESLLFLEFTPLYIPPLMPHCKTDMRRLGICVFFIVFCGLLGPEPARSADAQSQGPDFKEVYGLIHDHLEGVTDAELNHAAVQGLVSELAGRVSLVRNDTAESSKALISKTNLFEGGLAYVRIGQVSDGLGKVVGEACRTVIGTNKLNGVVLDLRYTGGDDYQAAANTADLFVKTEQPLLDWGQGMVRSAPKDGLGVPATVLVNRQTTGAAEALAAVLREAGAGLVLGGRTAGQGMIAREFPLSGGEKLRIASAPVHLADGSALAPQGVKPDIEVNVTPQDERAYMADPFRDMRRTNIVAAGPLVSTNGAAGTNRVRRTRFNEAELVRERKEGVNSEVELTTSDEDAEHPTVRDPVLARALDVLKGLTVVRQSRS